MNTLFPILKQLFAHNKRDAAPDFSEISEEDAYVQVTALKSIAVDLREQQFLLYAHARNFEKKLPNPPDINKDSVKFRHLNGKAISLWCDIMGDENNKKQLLDEVYILTRIPAPWPKASLSN